MMFFYVFEMLFLMFLKTFFTQDVKNQVLLTNMWLSLVCQTFFIPFPIPDFINSTFRFPDPFCYDFLHEILLCTYVAESFYILMFTITIKGAWIRRWTLFFDWLAADKSASWHKWLPWKENHIIRNKLHLLVHNLVYNNIEFACPLIQNRTCIYYFKLIFVYLSKMKITFSGVDRFQYAVECVGV